MASHYRAQATTYTQEASRTTLPNVVAKLRHSEAAWLTMVDQLAYHLALKAAARSL